VADDLRQRYAEALAAKFTSPIPRCDKWGENEWVESPEPADRVEQVPIVMLIAGDGRPSFRMPTCTELAEVVAAVRDDELQQLRARVAEMEATPVDWDAQRRRADAAEADLADAMRHGDRLTRINRRLEARIARVREFADRLTAEPTPPTTISAPTTYGSGCSPLSTTPSPRTPMTPEPLAVYDVREEPFRSMLGTPWHMCLLDWLVEEGFDPLDIYRVEVYLVDCPSARVYSYARNEDGKRYLASELDLARRPPYDVILSSLPPDPPPVPETP
jgi:hypothetical protein